MWDFFLDLDPWVKIIIMAIVCLIIIGFCNSTLHKLNNVDGKEKAYRDALHQLSQNPNNKQLKMATLQLGREYYSAKRNGDLTIYDEQALNNDINSAC